MALSTLTVALGLVGSLLAPLTLRPAQFVGLLLVGAFVGAFVALLSRSVAEDRTLGTREALSEAGRNGAVGAVWTVAAGVLVLSLGDSGWAVVAAAAFGYPLLRSLARLVRRSQDVRTWDHSAAERGRTRLSTPPFENCSTSELAAAWGVSYDMLQAASSPRIKARIVALREAYLDELERRDRLGLRRWLTTSADPASDTGPFFRNSDDGGEPRPGVASD